MNTPSKQSRGPTKEMKCEMRCEMNVMRGMKMKKKLSLVWTKVMWEMKVSQMKWVWWMKMCKMSQMKWVTWIRINEYEMNVMWWYGYESNEMRRWENESDEWNERSDSEWNDTCWTQVQSTTNSTKSYQILKQDTLPKLISLWIVDSLLISLQFQISHLVSANYFYFLTLSHK